MKHWEFVGYSFKSGLTPKKSVFGSFYKEFYFQKGCLSTRKANFPHRYVKKEMQMHFLKNYKR